MTSTRPWLAAALVGALLPGCLSGSGDAASGMVPGLEKVATISFADPANGNALGGAGDVVAVAYTDVSSNGSTAGFRETLQLYRRDAATPEDLTALGSVYLGVDTLYHRVDDLTVTADWATVTMNYNDAAFGWVAFVALGGAAPTIASTFEVSPWIDTAVASGRWAVISAATEVALVDLSTPAAPAIVGNFTALSPVTCLLPVADGFLVFTSTGYAHLGVTGGTPSWTETASPELRLFEKGFVEGTSAYVGGPSPIAGHARFGQLDVSDPAHPVPVLHADVAGLYRDFSYDGHGRYLVVTSDGSASAFTVQADGRALVGGGVGRINAYGRGPRLYAREGLAYALFQGIDLYRLP